ncbi:MAG TPA: CehA/McbA family metallohydrolase [Planctomycetota bacterium]
MRTFIAALLIGAAGLSFGPADDCALTLELVDAKTGEPLWGVVSIDGRPLPELQARGLGVAKDKAITRWSVLPERATVRVPRGKLAVEAFRGLETRITRVEADTTGRAEAYLKIGLIRFHDAGAAGWRAGNTHLHLQKVTREEADRYLREVPRADALEAVFLSHLERADDDRAYVSNGYTADDLRGLSKTGVVFGNGEEHRHNFTPFGEGYGHVMFLDIQKLIRPVSVGFGITKQGTDGTPLSRGIDEAKKDGATILWCHNDFGHEKIAAWARGRLDAMNIFDGGVHGSYRHTFYRYLNAAMRVPFSTGTDWFIYDFSRVYVRLPAPFTVKDFLRELAAGKSFITNGPFLDFKAGGREIGDTLRLDKPGKVTCLGRAVGRVDFRRIELIRNGEVVATADSRPRAGEFEAKLDVEIDLSEPGWLALRTPPPPVKDDPEFQDPVPLNEYGEPLFGHTSPIYAKIDGMALVKQSAVLGLIEELARSRETVSRTGTFGEGEREAVLRVYDEGLAALRKLLNK